MTRQACYGFDGDGAGPNYVTYPTNNMDTNIPWEIITAPNNVKYEFTMHYRSKRYVPDIFTYAYRGKPFIELRHESKKALKPAEVAFILRYMRGLSIILTQHCKFYKEEEKFRYNIMDTYSHEKYTDSKLGRLIQGKMPETWRVDTSSYHTM